VDHIQMTAAAFADAAASHSRQPSTNLECVLQQAMPATDERLPGEAVVRVPLGAFLAAEAPPPHGGGASGRNVTGTPVDGVAVSGVGGARKASLGKGSAEERQLVRVLFRVRLEEDVPAPHEGGGGRRRASGIPDDGAVQEIWFAPMWISSVTFTGASIRSMSLDFPAKSSWMSKCAQDASRMRSLTWGLATTVCSRRAASTAIVAF